MALEKSYDPERVENHLMQAWQEKGIYNFAPQASGPVYAIDTPPPTVSGHLHLGHVYSYSHTDFIARFWRMNGYNVFYPMGFDDNGLPTERLVEKHLGIRPADVGRTAFIEKCLEVSEAAEKDYVTLWKKLGLSIDWRYSYRTIDEISRRTAQLSFLRLHQQGLIYRKEAPAIWCPECHTAIAQAELNDLERESEFVTLPFESTETSTLEVATTRPELLPACVAVFVHPLDPRYRSMIGQTVVVPLFGQRVPILEDPGVDPEKGTGAVMCCTFGDTADVGWWHTHRLPLVQAIDRQGRMTAAAGSFAGLPVNAARRGVKDALAAQGLILARQVTMQSVRVHERCDTPVEYIVAGQWFTRVLDFKADLLKAGESVVWHPAHMQARYRAWVENLNWDWCLSRQRFFGVPFPVWYCRDCGDVQLAEEDQLPIDPLEASPSRPCACGSESFIPERDVMDTWATSSLSPQIVGRWLEDPQLFAQVYPFSLRPQAHEIIRTWAFYSLVKSSFHFNLPPWKEVMISGWGLAGEGMGKISKSRGGGPLPPLEMIARYSADAVRYWAASTGTGKDSVISEDKIQMGAKLVTKLWNVARFSERFIEKETSHGADVPRSEAASHFTPADRWILSGSERLVRRVTGLFRDYDYAGAKAEIEAFFWRDLADNYLEMAKLRLYDAGHPRREAARFTLRRVLLTLLKLFAPLLPYVTDAIYAELLAGEEGVESIHQSRWPEPHDSLVDEQAVAAGELLVEIATAVRRYKSDRSLSLGAELNGVQLACPEPGLARILVEAADDLKSVTRARQVLVVEALVPGAEIIGAAGEVTIGVRNAHLPSSAS